MKHRLLHAAAFLLAFPLHAAELHVAMDGDDAHPGTPEAPLRTIQSAADLAQPGDVITVHAGVYRERVNPPRGGESDAKRIIYQAAKGEDVTLTGAEIVKGWEPVKDGVWKVVLPNDRFGGFNPFSDLIRGDWFNGKGRPHHTGAVYLNGEWLAEAAKRDDVTAAPGASALWFGEVDQEHTTLWAQFGKADPNKELVEINVRRTVFYPEKTGINFLTVRGFKLCQAATPWAPPTAEQIGLIGTHWSKGWIIENNVVRHSVCSGIALGKYGDEWDNKAGTAEGYVGTINRALKHGWNKDTIGHHVVRHNTISDCEQTGIVGSLGAVFSTISDNTIHDIHVRCLFTGAEMAGIKLHGAIDVEISHNHIYRTCRGVWLDWMAQGTRVSRNLFHDNADQDLFVEVDHGPFVVDHNLFLSPGTLLCVSQSGAYVHNLIAGSLHSNPFDGRMTPFHKPHSTEVAGMHNNPNGDDRYYNNIFAGRWNASALDHSKLPEQMAGNVFLKGATPCAQEPSPLVQADFDPALKLVAKADGFYLEMNYNPAWNAAPNRPAVTTGLLGKSAISACAYENPDGTPLRIDSDYFGKPRGAANPAAGPFVSPGADRQAIKVW